jgi:hypothetical protein
MTNFLPNQSFQEENIQTNMFQMNHQTFSQRSLVLIKTLPIESPNQSDPDLIYHFIQLSITFWNQVIPPQIEEPKYSIDKLSKDINYFVSIIQEHHYRHTISLDISNETKFILRLKLKSNLMKSLNITNFLIISNNQK